MGELAASIPVPSQAQWGGIAWIGLVALCFLFLSMARR
jgi:hypothetical protein